MATPITPINEFKSDDTISEIPDPTGGAGAHANRGADKSDGQTDIGSETFKSKAEALSAIMARVQNYSKVDLHSLYNSMSNAANLASIKAKPSAASAANVKEDVEDIFAGTTITEELKEKATVIFEAALSARLVSEVARLDEEFETKLEEAAETQRVELVEQVDKFLNYIVEQWLEENRVATDAKLKTELTADFINGLKGLFAEHYIDVPTERVDVIAELNAKVSALETKLNEQITTNATLKESLNVGEVDRILVGMSSDLAKTQAVKLKTLVEGIDYTSPEEFKKKATIIKETYFGTAVKPSSTSSVNFLSEETDEEEEVPPTVTGPMSQYVDAISKSAKKS